MSSVELTAKQHNKIQRAIKSLNDVREELQEDNPEFDLNWYLEDCSSLNLMDGDSHDDDRDCSPRQDRIIATYYLKNSSGGGW